MQQERNDDRETRNWAVLIGKMNERRISLERFRLKLLREQNGKSMERCLGLKVEAVYQDMGQVPL
jgi:hypothetical protein